MIFLHFSLVRLIKVLRVPWSRELPISLINSFKGPKGKMITVPDTK